MKIVAVTACPTGIAHTYMAAEQLGFPEPERTDYYANVWGAIIKGTQGVGSAPK